ncbi:MAG: hypothetical protein ACRDMX_07550 [Solirubrobacteraceae bacterium]
MSGGPGVLLGRLEQASWLLAEVRHRRDCWAPQRHPFIERWTAGALTGSELRLYAEEHHQVVVSLAQAARRAADLTDGLLGEQLRRHARERADEADLWCAFALAAGWPGSAAWCFGADPLPQTSVCARIWTGDDERTAAAHLVTIYVLETAAAEVARPQRDALRARYGLRDERSVAWFSARCRGDAGPAGLIEAAITGLLPVQDPFALVRHAERSYRAYWELLDGIELYARATRAGATGVRATGAGATGDSCASHSF